MIQSSSPNWIKFRADLMMQESRRLRERSEEVLNAAEEACRSIRAVIKRSDELIERYEEFSGEIPDAPEPPSTH